MSFASLGLRPGILDAIGVAGYTEPTPIQLKAIPLILAGEDVIGVAQTGTGKTAAFVLPLLEKLAEKASVTGRPRVLILAPTRELAVQIDESVRAYAGRQRVRSITIYGGVSEGPQISALRRGVDIIVATPGRLFDLMQRKHVKLDGIEHLVLDEADRMLDMGFLPTIRRIITALPKQRQTVLFSATFSREIEQIASDFLHKPQSVEIGRRAASASSVTQHAHLVHQEGKGDLLLDLLSGETMRSVLVFSRTKHGADKIAKKLDRAGVKSATIHGNRSQPQRLRALESFKSGEVRVLVATDIAARGIDIDDISHVINYDFPQVPEDYVHRIGRTGRAAASGSAISFVTMDDTANLARVEKLIGKRVERSGAHAYQPQRHTTPAAPVRRYTTGR